VTVALYQGASTLIATWTQAVTGAFATYEHTLSGGQADSITNYADLRVRMTSV
jgi:hypothetical protein